MTPRVMSVRAWRRASRVALALVIGIAGLLQPAAPLHAEQGDDVPLPNWYEPFKGEPFFLLSDATYGSRDAAKVRVEVNDPDTLEQAGGVDIVLYRIPQPIAFLEAQKNLHRVQVPGRPGDEGLANTLTHLWDNWVVKARLAWQQLFSVQARQAVTRQAPELKTPKDLKAPSVFEMPSQFRPIPGLPLVSRFRYPLHRAQPIQPPKDVKLAGSSSEFITPAKGNVFVPLGPQQPGLYLVEAIVGQHRATTLLFVSDTVALTKVSGQQMLVWAAQRGSGAPVPGTRVVWTDGVGVLSSGSADARGLVQLDRSSPEQTYVFGQDPSGGVFISENFYYDSEIYAAKVYAVTDRPLYRPGDWVHVKVSGREFRSAHESVPMKDGEMQLSVVDPMGQVLLTQPLHFSGTQGADVSFALPANAPGGGYELRFATGDDSYTAAFRVADYQKPHFEILVLPDKADVRTGEPITGTLQLNYPDGKPVAHAQVSLTVRAQQLTMVEGELDYGGQFPLKLTQDVLVTDRSGSAQFSLPPATQPSRYILTALATDGAAYRVRVSRELLVERGSTSYKLTPDRQFSRPGDSVNFAFAPSLRAVSGADGTTRPAHWDWVRLEDRSRAHGDVGTGNALALRFPQPGSYTVTLRDDHDRIVAATSHWVSGNGAKAPAGSVTIVFDKPRYRAGETAQALVTFPEPIDHALLTLERDRVEAAALTGQGADWVKTERIAPTQWKLTLPVRDAMSPNMTLSVAYVKDGDYVFENQGLLVEQPRIALAFHTAKPVYAPGETVNVDVSATLSGQPVAADLTVGVVDEMIYVLQPEIAPTIDDFFFHPRRDNVRTSASLSFIGYDLATSKLGDVPAAGQVHQRAVKVLERPRRDEVDTAAWLPHLSTDASGHAHFSFRMPDSLTRWRITGRAMDAAGNVGQQRAWLRSDKAFYAKWSSPRWQRQGDQAQASIALFNQTGQAAAVEWAVKGDGVEHQDRVTLKPGINFVTLPLKADRVGAATVSLTLTHDGRVVDRLDTDVRREPVAWRSPHEQRVDIGSGRAALTLPPDAQQLRVSFAQDAAAGEFSRWMDDLIDDPYGCVEQTASRMLPLSIALQSLAPAQQPLAPLLTQRLATARLALVQMAGPNAVFGWWGRWMHPDAFLTAYAYYADWRATQALHTPLPDDHWQHLLEVYAHDGQSLPPVQQALALAWMQEMGLPVAPMAANLLGRLQAMPVSDKTPDGTPQGSVALGEPDTPLARDIAWVLTAQTANAAQVALAPEQRAAADAAAARLAPIDAPFVQALLIATHRASADKAAGVLAQVHADAPTFDRAQALLWLQRGLGGRAAPASAEVVLPAPWKRIASVSGQVAWQWPAGQPLPTMLMLPDGAKAAWAFVSFDSAEAPSPSLPVHLERTLWRVVADKPQVPAGKPASQAGKGQRAAPAVVDDEPGRLHVHLEKVAPGGALDTDTLYVDRIEVRSERPLQRALIEAALPPGASVEAGTWGIDVDEGDGKVVPMEGAREQPTSQGYAVPVEALPAQGHLVVRHLLRFAQRGQFKLPPLRLYRMYQPEAKAVDASGAWAQVEVR